MLKKYLQHIFSEAPLPLSLAEEVVEVAAKSDEDKSESQKPKNTCKRHDKLDMR